MQIEVYYVPDIAKLKVNRARIASAVKKTHPRGFKFQHRSRYRFLKNKIVKT